MRAIINDVLELNSPDSGCYINGSIEGLELPPSRDTEGSYSGVDGGYIAAQDWDMRLVTFSGVIIATSASQMEERRRAVVQALQSKQITLQLFMDDGRSYTLYGHLPNNGLDMPRNPLDPNLTPLRIDIKCPDPIIYETTSGSELSVIISRLSGGGFETPIITPRISEGGSLPSTITNTGQLLIYPTIILEGIATNPSINNLTINRSLKLSSFSMGSSDQVVIDMRERTALLNESSIMSYIQEPKGWWGLLVGDNSVSLTTDSSDDTATATILWRSGVMGI